MSSDSIIHDKVKKVSIKTHPTQNNRIFLCSYHQFLVHLQHVYVQRL